MGNITSCSSSISIISNTIRSAKSTETAILLDYGGKIREIMLPAKSGELMIEEIGHVITPAEKLRRTRRISALGADVELMPGKVYLLLPVSRVHSKASEFEIALADGHLCVQRKRRSRNTNNNKVKISPSPLPSPVSGLTELDGEIEVTGLLVCPKARGPRRWNPVLDPILESI